MAVLIVIHMLAATLWVGGLFFMLGLLRPAGSRMPLGERLPLLAAAVGRFFGWIWLAIIALTVTGYAMIVLRGGMGAVPAYVDLMQVLAALMFVLYAHMFFGPWQRLRRCLAAGALSDASRAMNQLRARATILLVLGVLTIIVASGGRGL